MTADGSEMFLRHFGTLSTILQVDAVCNRPDFLKADRLLTAITTLRVSQQKALLSQLPNDKQREVLAVFTKEMKQQLFKAMQAGDAYVDEPVTIALPPGAPPGFAPSLPLLSSLSSSASPAVAASSSKASASRAKKSSTKKSASSSTSSSDSKAAAAAAPTYDGDDDNILLPVIRRMMASFGDASVVNQDAAIAVYDHLALWGNAVVNKLGPASVTHKSGLSSLMSLYPSQSAMFFRWREMKKASKDDDKPISEATEGDDEDEELDSDDEAKQIEDAKAVMASRKRPQVSLTIPSLGLDLGTDKRMALHDLLTQTMTTAEYLAFAKNREASFVQKSPKAKIAFMALFNIPRGTKAMFISLFGYLAWDRVGMLVEVAKRIRWKARMEDSKRNGTSIDNDSKASLSSSPSPSQGRIDHKGRNLGELPEIVADRLALTAGEIRATAGVLETLKPLSIASLSRAAVATTAITASAKRKAADSKVKSKAKTKTATTKKAAAASSSSQRKRKTDDNNNNNATASSSSSSSDAWQCTECEFTNSVAYDQCDGICEMCSHVNAPPAPSSTLSAAAASSTAPVTATSKKKIKREIS